MKTIIANEIIIQNPTDKVKKWCKNNLIYENPEYYRKKAMGFWLGNTPKNFRMFTVSSNVYRLPFGVLRRIWKLIKNDEYEVRFKVKKIYPRSLIKLYDYQEKAVEKMIKARNGVLISKAGSGKGHPLDTILYTPTGKVRLGDLKIGDKLIGSDGKPITVTNIFDRGILDTYEVTFTDNTSIECDGEHLFNFQYKTERDRYLDRWHTLNVLELKEKIEKENKSCFIPIVKPVEFEHKDVEIDAWLLGVLIGDGGLTQKQIKISNSEEDIIKKIKQKLPDTDKLKYLRNNNYAILKKEKGKEKTSILKSLIKYDLFGKYSYEKHIPDEYKYNDINIRLEILRGLIDTDGSVERNRHEITITTTSKKLALDIIEIVQSLSGTAKMSTRHAKYTYNGEKRNGRESYRVYIKLYEYIPFSSEKHLKKYKPRIKYNRPYRKIKSIEYIGKKEIRCIAVDAKDKLYVANDFIVTHNTQMMLELICRLGYKALWINNKKDLMQQALDRAKSNIVNCEFGTITEGKVNIGDITFSTIQTLSKIDLDALRDEFGVIVCDELQTFYSSPSKLTQTQKALSRLSARYKYGCTACLHRSDKLEKTALDLVGDVIYEVPESEIADKIIRASIQPVHTNFVPRECLGADGVVSSFSELINELCFDEERNNLIIEDIINNKDKHCIVLSDRLEQLRYLKDKLGFGLMIDGSMVSKKGKEQRREAIEKMRTGEEHVLFASYSLAKEGLDIPILDRLFLASPKRDKSVIIQSVGRIERIYEGKSDPIVYDYVDDCDINFSMLEKMFNGRKTIYRKNGNQIIQRGKDNE